MDAKIVAELSQKFADFRRTYEDKGLKVEEFHSFPPTVRTLRQFSESCHRVSELIRDFMLPNADE